MDSTTDTDWQMTQTNLKERTKYLMQTSWRADCHFLVGDERNQRKLFAGHKLILSMTSPVFDAMFHGSLAETSDPIPIVDLDPAAFKLLLEYIYTEEITINSVDEAFELCYCAKKYMVPQVVERCVSFLWSDLNPKNVCKAYEFAKLFEEPELMKQCLNIISMHTFDIINDEGFQKADLSTVTMIMEQETLKINTEMDLFWAVKRYAEKHKMIPKRRTGISATSTNDDGDRSTTEATGNTGNDEFTSLSLVVDPAKPTKQRHCRERNSTLDVPTIRDALRHIRFLTLTPKQFAEGPVSSNLFTKADAFAILMNIASSDSCFEMPDGFSTNRRSRGSLSSPCYEVVHILDSIPSSPSSSWSSETDDNDVFVDESLEEPQRESEAPASRPPSPPPDPVREPLQDNAMSLTVPTYAQKYYCRRKRLHQVEYLKKDFLEAGLKFSISRTLCITGIKVPAQVQLGTSPRSDYYTDTIRAQLFDSFGNPMTYARHDERIKFNSILELTFQRPVLIQPCKIYKLTVNYSSEGLYPTGRANWDNVKNSNATFSFYDIVAHSIRAGLIREIIYQMPRRGIATT